MKTLIVLSAIPASGKSTWAKHYAEEHPNAKVISSDALRIEVTGTYLDHTREKEVWETFDKRIKEYSKIDGVTVVLDALNDLNWLRQKYVKENPEFDKYVLLLFSTPIDATVQYNSQREEKTRVPKEIMMNLISKYEKVDQETSQLYNEIYEYNWKENKFTQIK